MKVAMYYNNSDVRIEEMSVPDIDEEELLVEVKACGICGSDVMEWYRIKKAPLVLGHEMTGDIVKVGENVEEYSVGDRVFVSHHVPCNTCCFCLKGQHTICDTLHSTNFYPGGFSEYLRVPSINVDRGVFVLPENMSYDEGVFIEPLACVLRGLDIAGFEPGDSMLVLGSGVAGLSHIKAGKALGMGRIFSTDINEDRLDKAESIGADGVFHAEEDIPELVKKNNDGQLADLVVVCAGIPSVVKQAMKCVEHGGTILFFAPTEPEVEVSFPLFDLWNKQVKMVSTYAGAPRDLSKAIDLISLKKVRVDDLITHRLPLSETEKGFRLVSEAEDSLKVIVKPPE